MKTVLSFILCLILTTGFSQLTQKERQLFGSSLNFNCAYNPNIYSMCLVVMTELYPKENLIEIRARIENIGNNPIIFNTFVLQIIKNSGNQNTSQEILRSLCSSASLAIKVFNSVYNQNKENIKNYYAENSKREEQIFKEIVTRYYETNGNDQANIKLILYNDEHIELVYKSLNEKSNNKTIIGKWKYNDSLIILNFALKDSVFVLAIFDTVSLKSNPFKVHINSNTVTINIVNNSETIQLWKISTKVVVYKGYEYLGESINQEEENNKVYTIVETPAEYPGGLNKWTKYLESNLNKDLLLKNGAPNGKYTVIVSFIIDKNGIISEVKAENDPGYGSKEEAIRLIKKIPAFTPALQNGRPVIYRHKQSISFLVDQ